MNGSYRGYSVPICIIGIVLFPLVCLFGAANTMYSVLVPCAFVPLLALLWLSDNMPCRFSADGDGFEISEMGFKTHYDYTDIWDIKSDTVHKKTGYYIKLTVSGSFGDKVYWEKQEKGGSQLVRLCGYVCRAKGISA